VLKKTRRAQTSKNIALTDQSKTSIVATANWATKRLMLRDRGGDEQTELNEKRITRLSTVKLRRGGLNKWPLPEKKDSGTKLREMRHLPKKKTANLHKKNVQKLKKEGGD